MSVEGGFKIKRTINKPKKTKDNKTKDTDSSKNSKEKEKKKSKKKEKEKKLNKEIKKKANKGYENFIYLDNNATTIICKEAKKAVMEWQECYNPSSDSQVAKGEKKVLEEAEEFILNHCGVTKDTHYAIFTSGATESNCTVIISACESYKRMSGVIPHVISTMVEHKSILECLERLKENDMCEYTLLPVTLEGSVKPASVVESIKTNTCLITIMYANNEIGVINNIPAIGAIAHDKNVPFHTDAVQLFGKTRILMDISNIDAISASCHKFYGPKGIGLLILNKKFIDGYKLQALITGTQQHGLRGGTENVPYIAAARVALKTAFIDREKKNRKMLAQRNYIIEKLTSIWNRQTYKDFLIDLQTKDIIKKIDKPDKPMFVILGPGEEEKTRYLPSTILVSFINYKELPIYGPPPQDLKSFCNRKLKKDLDKDKVVVSITSACLTSSDKASHVLKAIEAPPIIKKGVIRISMGDYNTDSQIKMFVSKLQTAVEKQIF